MSSVVDTTHAKYNFAYFAVSSIMYGVSDRASCPPAKPFFLSFLRQHYVATLREVVQFFVKRRRMTYCI